MPAAAFELSEINLRRLKEENFIEVCFNVREQNGAFMDIVLHPVTMHYSAFSIHRDPISH